MSIPSNLWQALMLRAQLTVEVAASSPERIAAVTIFPKRYELDLQAEIEGWRASIAERTFYVYWREYSRESIEKNWEMDAGYNMWDIKRVEVVGKQALEQLLLEWNIPHDGLTYLWKTNIPE